MANVKTPPQNKTALLTTLLLRTVSRRSGDGKVLFAICICMHKQMFGIELNMLSQLVKKLRKREQRYEI